MDNLNTIEGLTEFVRAKRDELKAFLQAKTKEVDGKSVYDMTPDDVTEFQKRNEELNAAGEKLDNLKSIAQAKLTIEGQEAKEAKEAKEAEVKARSRVGWDQGSDAGDESGEPFKSFGDLFVESDAYKSARGGHKNVMSHATVKSVKTLFETSAGWEPQSVRLPRVELTPERRLRVFDIVSSGPTQMDTVKYMEETTFTSAAAEVAEGGAYGEAALALTERSQPVEKIAVWIPVTDEQLEDVDMVRDYLNARLGRMARARLDSQMLVGSGVAPNLRGILNTSGIQTQALGVDTRLDAFLKAITLVRHAAGYSEPDAVVLHPTDWQEMIIASKDANGQYLLGTPGTTAPERLWGLPLVVTDAITLGTGLVGAFRDFAWLFLRRDLTFAVSNSHASFFVEGKQAIRVDLRAAFVVFRPKAFCTVTGI